jgi:hypothetical protein
MGAAASRKELVLLMIGLIAASSALQAQGRLDSVVAPIVAAVPEPAVGLVSEPVVEPVLSLVEPVVAPVLEPALPAVVEPLARRSLSSSPRFPRRRPSPIPSAVS